MTLENWYHALGWMHYGAIAMLAIFGIWYIICICKHGNAGIPAIGIIVSGLFIVAILIPKWYIESKIYPPGKCPNCEQSVATQYCADCGWQNDSYFEQTDKS